MDISYRYYQGPEDLQLQYDFWMQITVELPFAWKPTTSPTQFYKSEDFDPHTRCFAFEGDQLVGYMSFTGSGNFISLGYPWVIPGYESIRDELWNRVYSYAIGEYGGKMIAQRFRQQWETQIDYFLEKGLAVTTEEHIYGIELDEIVSSQTDEGYGIEKIDKFDIEEYLDHLRSHTDVSPQVSQMTRMYYDTISFDYNYIIIKEDHKFSYLGITHRKDNNFGEIIALSLNQEYVTDFVSAFPGILEQLAERGMKIIAVTLQSESPLIEIFKQLDFRLISKDIYLGQQVE